VKAPGVFKLVIATCALSLIAGHLSSATAAPAAQVITCVDLVSGKERISKTGTCRTAEATAKWHLAPTDSALASGGRTKSLTICSNKESSPVTYQRIRTSCYKHMQTNLYTRSSALPSKPVITQVSSTSYESASLALARDPAANLDAPIAYYTITSSKGDVKKVNSWRELTVTISGLRSSTPYTFTITATSVDGTSLVSESSLPVTTQVYVAPVASATTAPLAAPAFTLSNSSETRTVNTAATGFTINSTGGAIASYAISATPTGMSFSTSTGALTGTPTTVAGATAYTVTATNASGSATQAFTLTVTEALAAPAFTLSSSSETRTVNTAATGFTINSTGGAIASYAISPSAPAGLTFNTTTGALSGTPTSAQSATAYTVTATNATGSATRTFTLTVAPVAYADGITWTSRTSAADNGWTSVAYGNGTFVAVAQSGSGNRVMTSPDGITWTSRTSAADNDWWGVTYGNGTFVAVSTSGTGNRVMTSPDGITWTSRTSAADNDWRSVTYGNGIFVAVAQSGSGNRVMTSPDGITWTSRTSAADNVWYGVTYGNGTFVAVAGSGTGNRVMTSPDGITWTSRTSAADNAWYGVTYGNGTFVATSITGTGNRVMTSPDGITWTSRTTPIDNAWYWVTYGNGTFVATALSGTGNRVMTSPDGITWTSRTSAANNAWRGVTYGNGTFVAVSIDGTGNRVMTSTP
jgi:hypothetical protein